MKDKKILLRIGGAVTRPRFELSTAREVLSLMLFGTHCVEEGSLVLRCRTRDTGVTSCIPVTFDDTSTQCGVLWPVKWKDEIVAYFEVR
jgi:hypothetical protein